MRIRWANVLAAVALATAAILVWRQRRVVGDLLSTLETRHWGARTTSDPADLVALMLAGLLLLVAVAIVRRPR